MIQLVYSPIWFYGKDIAIDIISMLVLFFIAFFSIRYYRISKKNRNYLHLGLSFLLIGASFIFKILTNFTIYYKVPATRTLGFITLTYPVLKYTNLLFFFGFYVHRVLMLIGFYLLYCIYQKKSSKVDKFIVIYLILVLTYFSQWAYYVFHANSLIILMLLIWQYGKNYKKNKSKTAKLLLYSFQIIAVSQVFFIFVSLNDLLYVIAMIIQLIGYIMLLTTFIMVIKYGKKKK